MKTAAILIIKAPGKMNKKGRRMIAGWLKRQARHFIARGGLYTTGNYTARYIYK